MLRFVKTLFALLAFVGAGAAHASAIALGVNLFNSEQFGNSLMQSDGGAFAAASWLNTSAADPGSPGYLTGANFDTGIANIGLGTGASYTIGYDTAIVNDAGADIGIVTARFSTGDTITLTINGFTMGFGPSLAAATGQTRAYYYGDPSATNTFEASLFVTTVDLAAFGVANGASINSIVVTGSPQLDLIRVAGLNAAAVTDVPEPESLALLGLGALVAAVLRRRR